MGLFHFTLVLLLVGVFAEPTIKVMVSKAKAKRGEDVTITCRVTNAESGDVAQLVKYVEIDEKDEEGNKKVFEEGVAVNDNLEVLYVKQGRHSMTSTSSGSNGVDYILKIQNVQPQDSATYACSITGTVAYDAKLFEVYTAPQNVHFMNFSNWDLNVDILHLDEGQTENVGCMAMGGVPRPRFEIVVGDNNYTKKFKHHESKVVLPDCYEQGASDNCLLHFSTESEVEAAKFRPYYTANGKYLECKAYIDGSGMEPVSAKLMVSMRYSPKFFCWQKHKVAMHTQDYELKCSVLTNPKLDNVQFEFQWNGEKTILKPGQGTSDGEIRFLKVDEISNTETEVILKFSEIFERHYEVGYKLWADNELGPNSTMLELVDETYVRSSASVVVHSGILALFACILSFFML